MINIVEGKNLIDDVGNYDVILVGTNCYCSLRNGFQYEIKLSFPHIQENNNKTKYGDVTKLGTVVECDRQDGQPIFVLCFITKCFNCRPHAETDYLSYESLESCLKYINILYKGKKIATTILGSSKYDGNGNRERILEIFNNSITECDITLYDYQQESFGEYHKRKYFEELKVKETNREEYYKLVKLRKSKRKNKKKNKRI